MHPSTPSTDLLQKIRTLLADSRSQVVQAINTTMVYTYYEIGRYIVEDEQAGNARADYAQSTLKKLSKSLTKEFGRGFSVQNLRLMRQFFQTFQKRQTVSGESKFLSLS